MPQEQPIADLTKLPDNAPWWAKYLVDNRAGIKREFSTWILAILAAVPLVQEAVPNLHLGESVNHYATIALALLAIVAKVVKQPSKGNEV